MKTIVCSTRFDITATGVLGQYKENRVTINQATGAVIRDRDAWVRARNQQRNWETMTQIILLRCLPENIVLPKISHDNWWFEFDVDSTAALSAQPDDLAFLISDAHGVPMITGLDESNGIAALIRTHGEDLNTWFQTKTDKYQIGESPHA